MEGYDDRPAMVSGDLFALDPARASKGKEYTRGDR